MDFLEMRVCNSWQVMCQRCAPLALHVSFVWDKVRADLVLEIQFRFCLELAGTQSVRVWFESRT